MFKIHIVTDSDGLQMLHDAAMDAGTRVSGAPVPLGDILRLAASRLLRKAEEADNPDHKTLLGTNTSLDFTLEIKP